jgi:hypothetical protein
MTEKLLGGSLYAARMVLQRRAESAESRLATATKERDELLSRDKSWTIATGNLIKERDEAIKAAYSSDMFDPTKRGESYKGLWEAATEMAADDHKEHCRLMREADGVDDE